MSDNTELIAWAVEHIDPTVGYAYASDWDAFQANTLIERLTSALVAAESRTTEADRQSGDTKRRQVR